MRIARLWELFIELTAYLFNHSRPQFHYSLLVLYGLFWYVVTFWMLFALMGLFGSEHRIDFELLGELGGSLAFGGLVAGHVHVLTASERVRNWLVPMCSGGFTVTPLWLISNLRWGNAPTFSGLMLAFGGGAGMFLLLAWLIRLDAAAKAKAAARQTERP